MTHVAGQRPSMTTELVLRQRRSGFHSNDARGATTSEDPVTHEAADRVTPLVRATGAEFRHADGGHSARADDGHRVDARPRLGAGVFWRRGHDRSRPTQSTNRRRVGQLLESATMDDARCGSGLFARAIRGRRSRWRSYSWRGRRRCLGRRLHGEGPRRVWGRPGPLLWSTHAHRGQQPFGQGPAAS